MIKKIGIYGLFLVLFLAACVPTTPEQIAEQVSEEMEETGTTEVVSGGWRNIPFKDVRTGETFTISSFIGEQILLESMAVWCPVCTAQQRRISDLHDELGDAFVSISLDTDPNEDEAKLRDHAISNGFNWRFAVSPTPATQSLIAEFGLSIVNAPQAPVVLVCKDQSARFLGRGLKSVNELKVEMEKGC